MARFHDLIVVNHCRNFGSALIEMRKTLGYSQELVADRAGIDASNLCRIERGFVSPSIDTALRILAVFDSELQILY